MGIAKLKLWAAAGMSLAVFGTAGLGLMSAPAGQEKGKPKDPPAAAAKADPPTKPEEPKTTAPPQAETPPPIAAPTTDEDVRAALAKEFHVRNIAAVPSFAALATQVMQQIPVSIHLDYAAFKRVLPPDIDPTTILESKPPPMSSDRMSIREVLEQAAAFTPIPSAIQVRGNKIMIVPAYLPAAPSGGDNMPTATQLVEQAYGPPVHLGARNKPLAEVLRSLRDQTGANIVLDTREGKADLSVTASLDDVRLWTALTVLADMCGLRLVVIGNVYYLTTPENAERMQKEVRLSPFGETPRASFTPPQRK